MAKALKLAWNTLATFIRFASPYWPVLAGLVAVYLVAFLFRRSRAPKLSSNAALLDCFFQHGYEVAAIIYQGRIQAEYVLARLGVSTYVQIWRQQKPVAEKSILQAKETCRDRSCEQAVVLSKSGFSRQARRQGLADGLWLLPFDHLETALERLETELAAASRTAAATKNPE